MTTNETRAGLIYTKIPKIMAKIDYIAKGRKNQQQGYAFRGIDDMYNEVHKHLADECVFVTSEVISHEREERESKSGGTLNYSIMNVRFTFFAEDGSSVTSNLIGEAMDSGDKASNKAMSVAYKYAFMQIFCIPTEEEKDTEYKSPEVKPKDKPVESESKDNWTVKEIKGVKYGKKAGTNYWQSKEGEILTDKDLVELALEK